MKKLIVDLDGVLANFNAGATEILKRIVHRFTPVADVIVPRKWDWSDILSREEFDHLWREIKESKHFWATLPPFAANVFALQQVSDEVEVYYLTSRPNTTRPALEQTREWLYNLHLDWGNLIVVPSSFSKLSIVRGLEADAMIDDYHDTVRICKYYTDAYLLAQPWNHSERHGLVAVDSMVDFLGRVMKDGH